jgi:hypothetical protein
MPKVMIELDLKENQAIPNAEDCARLTDPDWLCDWWSIWDVHCQANDDMSEDAKKITDDEARKVLALLNKHKDSCVGINWDVLDAWIDDVKEQREEAA